MEPRMIGEMGRGGVGRLSSYPMQSLRRLVSTIKAAATATPPSCFSPLFLSHGALLVQVPCVSSTRSTTLHLAQVQESTIQFVENQKIQSKSKSRTQAEKGLRLTHDQQTSMPKRQAEIRPTATLHTSVTQGGRKKNARDKNFYARFCFINSQNKSLKSLPHVKEFKAC